MVRNRGFDSILLLRHRLDGDSRHDLKWKGYPPRPVRSAFLAGFPGNRHVVKNMMFGKDVVVVEWEFRSRYKGPFAGTAATGSAVKLPGCGVLSIRSGEATAHRSPYLLRRHNLTQTDFVTPASSAPELADIVVCRAGLSTAREHVRHSH